MNARIIAAIMARTKPVHFGKRLARLRKARGITQRQLADLLGSSQRVVTYYENESSYPPAHLLPKVAEVFGVGVEELLGEAEPIVEAAPVVLDRRLRKRVDLLGKLSPQDQKMVLRMIDTLAAKKAS
jgi:transcriptional regulator with XRE-family HTH domain